MTPEEFVLKYPYVYHMAEADTWESIKRRGLLSTKALLDLFEIDGPQRAEIESSHRPESVEINHEKHGTAVIRDQKPMSDNLLRKCLIDMTPKQWYENLNSKVFFWLTQDRLFTLLGARAYRKRKHCVITADTNQLLNRYFDHITLSPMNSGCTMSPRHKRGRETFRHFNQYPFSERKGRKDTAVELAVDYKVLDVAEYTVKVEHIRGQEVLEVIYSV